MRRRDFLGMMAAAALAGCGKNDDKSAAVQTLRIIAIGSIETTDPHRAESPPERILAGEIHRGLLTVDASGQIVPGLAESWWVSEDGLSYIFRLRPAQWPDGRPLSPNDVVTSFRRMLAPGNRHPLSDWLAIIRNGEAVRSARVGTHQLGVRALTDTVVEIVLEKPRPAFLALLAEPSAAVVRHIRRSGKMELMGLGPYRVSARQDQKLSLEANSTSFGAQGLGFARIELTAEADPLAAIQAFREQRADIITGGAVTGITEASTFPTPAVLHLEQAIGLYGLVAQTRRGPLADVRLRRALAMTVDRQGLTRQLFNISAMTSVESLVPPGLNGYGDPALPDWAAWTLEQRLTEARRLFAEAGYGPDKPLPLTIALPRGTEDQQIIAAIASAWQALGVQVTAKIGTAKTLPEMISRGEFDLALRPTISSVDQPMAFLAPFVCEARRNVGGYCNEEADRLIDEAGETVQPADRAAIFKRAEQLMTNDAPAISLFVPVRWSLVRQSVTGWTENPAGRHPLSALKPKTAR